MDEFRDAIARITIENTDVRGTGFLVAPDLVATALHVVANRKTEPPTFFTSKITLHFQGRIGTGFTRRDVTAEAIQDRYNQDADCVLLKCEPLDGYPIIPLRELNESGGLWKTRGYPDAQSVDGMIWDGEVTAYNEQLTNSYETGDVPYQPVLQLLCKQAAAGTGAPPRGLSGAPVVIGTAAVGLLRYALMEEGHTIAATLYACSAKDIMALWPERLKLRPALALAVILSDTQTEQLTTLLSRAFPKTDELRRTIRFALGLALPPANGGPTFVSSMLRNLVQLGPGTIGVLLRAVITACPNDQDLRSFATTDIRFNYSLEPLDDDEERQDSHDKALVEAIIHTLFRLTRMDPISKVQKIVGTYRPAFEQTKQQIRVLARYKKLHDCLHEVQKRLNDIKGDIERLKKGDHVGPYLKERAKFIDEIARKAGKQITELPTYAEEADWIQKLTVCAADMRTTTDMTARAVDREKVLTVPYRLGRILKENVSFINGRLVDAAKRVQLDNFADTMRSVEQELAANMTQESLQSLRTGSVAVGRLRSRLAGLVAEHNEWQSLTNELEKATAQPYYQAQAKFSSWKIFKDRLNGLCEVFPGEEWSISVRRKLSVWPEDEPPPEPQLTTTKDQLREEFVGFYETCVERFIAVDNELNTLCDKITELDAPLRALLSM